MATAIHRQNTISSGIIYILHTFDRIICFLEGSDSTEKGNNKGTMNISTIEWPTLKSRNQMNKTLLVINIGVEKITSVEQIISDHDIVYLESEKDSQNKEKTFE